MKPVAHKALRPIAALEAFKGFMVLVAGFGLLSFLDRDNEVYAERIIRVLHLNPAHHYPQIFIAAMARMEDSHLLALAGLAALYSLVRFIEAYGLWFERRWAEWLAALSGGIYVPLEIYELIVRATWLKFAALVINLVVVAYMVWLLTETIRKRHLAQKKLTAPAGS
ncbi:MAG TPA: DUF2127 domain-containing protein [Lacunisphaera sp.]|nr:DUF2127 domain-containing protein [Lacunisphaera sp.]